MNKSLQTRILDKCRICGNQHLRPLLELCDSPLCDAYVTSRPLDKDPTAPLSLVGCSVCRGVFTSHVVEEKTIYEDYIYMTSLSPGLNNHFREYARAISKNLNLTRNDLVIDVGANDGVLLKHFKENYGLRVVGIEPSVRAIDFAEKNGVPMKEGYMTPALCKDIVKNFGRAKLLTMNNVFANIDNLNSIAESIDIVLDSDGTLVIETSYLWDMVDNHVFDFIYHEHLSYFSLFSIETFLKKNDLKVFHCDRVSTKGGSVRYYIARKKHDVSITDSLKKIRDFEGQRQDLEQEFALFDFKIKNLGKQCWQVLNRVNTTGKIYGYGASATSTTLLHTWQIGEYFTALIDDNPNKIGTFSPGFHIPVLSLDQCLLEPNDLVVVLAWRFEQEIKSRLAKFKGEIFTPLP